MQVFGYEGCVFEEQSASLDARLVRQSTYSTAVNLPVRVAGVLLELRHQKSARLPSPSSFSQLQRVRWGQEQVVPEAYC